MAPSQFPVTKSIRIDEELERKIEVIALYEKQKPGTLLRRWVNDKVNVFHRNPAYKRWLKLYEADKAKYQAR